MKKLRNISLVLICFFCLSAIVLGQEQFGNIEGFVKDSTGAVVPNVSITIRSSEGSTAGFKQTVTSNSDGFFRVLQIPAGNYIVTTDPVAGFSQSQYENIHVVLGKTTQLNIQLTVGGQSVTVDVATGDTPLDTTSSEISTSVSNQKIELLPKGTNFTSILKVIPGTRPEDKSGGFSIDGASGAENTFVIDGQEVTNYRNAGLNGNQNIPFELVQEVQVKSSGFNAEYGGATGGVINVVTKGGNNDFHGDIGTAFEPAKLQGNPRPTLLRFTSGSVGAGTYKQPTEYFSSPKAGGLNSFPSFNFSGPILKDKAWFFTSYSPQIYENNVHSVFYTAVPSATRTKTAEADYYNKTKYEYAFARIDASPLSTLRLTGTFLWNPVAQNGIIPYGTANFGGSPSVTPELARQQGGRQTSNNTTFQAVYTPLNSVVGTFRYSRGFLNEKLGNYGIPSGLRYICQRGNVGGVITYPNGCNQGDSDPSNTQTTKDISIRTNYEGDVSFLFGGLGRHELKGGYQHQSIFNDLLKNFTERVYLQYGDLIDNNFNWTSLATPTPGAIGHGVLYRYGERGSGSNLNQAIYIQDKWQPIQRLTLNLGVRIEKESLPSFNGFDAPFSFGWGDKVAPRIGGSFDLFGDGKTKIFGSYGKFYDRLKFKMAQGSFGGNFYRVDFFEIFPNSGPYRSAFTVASILGNFTDPIGGKCAPTGFIGSGLSRCQNDYRVASNVPGVNIEDAGGIDVNLKPYSQREFTFGVERELSQLYLLRGRYTNKKLLNTVEDAGAISSSGSEIYITGNPGQGLHAEFLKNFGYAEPYATPDRRYSAVEVVLERRLSNNYFFNLNYTYSRLRGNYSGLANADENGRSDPGVNRSFDLPMIGFTALGGSDSGPLPTDRPHVFNAYGGYIFDWFGKKVNNTELSFFQTFQSGTPQSTTVDYIVPIFFNKRGDLGRTPMFSQTDFNVSHKYRFGNDGRFMMAVNLNIINLFNQATVTRLYTDYSGLSVFGWFGCPTGDYPCALNAFNRGDLHDDIQSLINSRSLDGVDSRYGQPDQYQSGRGVRFGFKFVF
ncbi:MAG: carboxypeptidase regulatory-like domain-containing protein [Pyrinomonadaceae bacterium]|nr:carboxypeptidase regulatory-like domain-containing protein [Pyrinomonadaceae bacterium]